MDATFISSIIPTLSAETIRLLRATFDARQHRPSAAMWKGIEALATCLGRMAEGDCEDKFFLSSLDPGVGKTQTVVHFLRALLASPTHGHVGVVMFFSTKRQIEDVVDEADLQKGDFAVSVTDDEMAEKKLGDLGSGTPTTARVLFTTQQRLQLVCRDRSFAGVERFQFRGLPRQVRIWDERLLPAEEVTVNVYEIGGLYPALGRVRPELVPHLDQLRDRLWSCNDRDIIDVPNLAATVGPTLDVLLRHVKSERSDVRKTATDLWSLFGTKVSVRDEDKQGPTMVSIRDCVPSDLVPLVILDASGRVRTAYRWWEQHRNTLVRLEEAPKHYDNMVVHVWDIGGGKASFEKEAAWHRRRMGITKTINGKASERWLVVCHKDFSDRLKREVAAELQGDRDRAAFIHWGIHRASNEYRDITNVILAGTQFLRRSTYEGIGRAARDLRPYQGVLRQALQDEIALGELADLILQGVCRGVARKALNDHCPSCNVYIIARPFSGVRKLLPQVFPGCRVEEWQPMPNGLRGKVKAAFTFMCQWFEEHPGELLSVEEIMRGVGMTDRANFNRNIRRHADFIEAIADAGIYEERAGRKSLGFSQQLDEPSSFEDFFTSDGQSTTS
jgi:hypothetical protein